MRFHDSDEYRKQRELHVLHTGPSLTTRQCHDIFREMVRGEARNGRLSATRRKRLIQYAAALQLTPVQAGRIVTEVCREFDHPSEFEPPVLYRVVEAAAAPKRWPIWLKITLALLVAFFVDGLLRMLL
jgi:hypothetical protein